MYCNNDAITSVGESFDANVSRLGVHWSLIISYCSILYGILIILSHSRRRVVHFRYKTNHPKQRSTSGRPYPSYCTYGNRNAHTKCIRAICIWNFKINGSIVKIFPLVPGSGRYPNTTASLIIVCINLTLLLYLSIYQNLAVYLRNSLYVRIELNSNGWYEFVALSKHPFRTSFR